MGKWLSLMTWNWQQPEWPKFTWNEARLALAERAFLVAGASYWVRSNTRAKMIVGLGPAVQRIRHAVRRMRLQPARHISGRASMAANLW